MRAEAGWRRQQRAGSRRRRRKWRRLPRPVFRGKLRLTAAGPERGSPAARRHRVTATRRFTRGLLFAGKSPVMWRLAQSQTARARAQYHNLRLRARARCGGAPTCPALVEFSGKPAGQESQDSQAQALLAGSAFVLHLRRRCRRKQPAIHSGDAPRSPAHFTSAASLRSVVSYGAL